MIIIYGLYDPTDETKELRYVGYSNKTAEKRLNKHIEESTAAKSKHYHKSRWIVALKRDKDLIPVCIVLEELPDDGDWREAETRWIKYYRDLDHRLCNMTDGGDGVLGYHHTSDSKRRVVAGRDLYWTEENRSIAAQKTRDQWNSYSPEQQQEIINKRGNREILLETRTKISVANKGRQKSLETRKRLSNANTGRKHTDEARRNMSEAHKGKIQSDETRAKKIALWTVERREEEAKKQRGKKLSDETKAKIGEKSKGVIKTAETIEKLRVANIGRKHTPETREKISAVQRGRKISEETKQKIAATKAKNRDLRLAAKAAQSPSPDDPAPLPDDSDFFTFG